MSAHVAAPPVQGAGIVELAPSPYPYIGQTILVSVSAVSVLAVIFWRLADRLVVVAEGAEHWISMQDVAEWDPACPRCGPSRFWWTLGGDVRCTQCWSPEPDWSRGFRNLAALLAVELPDDDPRRQLIVDLAKGCDAAWGNDDWPLFQVCELNVRCLLVNGEAGR